MRSLINDKQSCRKRNAPVLVALGANIPGTWGEPKQTLRRALQHLIHHELIHLKISHVYRTRPIGSLRQPEYLNIVVCAESHISSWRLIRRFKELERQAGRRRLGLNGARPLDIDLLDYAGRVVNWSTGMRRPNLVLPHPLMADRPFVMVPLLDIASQWRHPVLNLSAEQIVKQMGGVHYLARRGYIKRVDSSVFSCDSRS